MDTTRETQTPDPRTPGPDGEVFAGWTLPDGTFEAFESPLTREELVARFAERCGATVS
ncbi:hypothetical protein [Kineococcus sp. G2]|uniref:hypothetical protein n=1 Tax=Kineococcus sp. G2 TaxID=3127484 RepID=UPI00301E5C7D